MTYCYECHRKVEQVPASEAHIRAAENDVVSAAIDVPRGLYPALDAALAEWCRTLNREGYL